MGTGPSRFCVPTLSSGQRGSTPTAAFGKSQPRVHWGRLPERAAAQQGAVHQVDDPVGPLAEQAGRRLAARYRRLHPPPP